MTLEEKIIIILDYKWDNDKAAKELAELVRIEVSNAFDAGDMYGYYIAGADAKPQPNKEQYINQLK